MATVTGYTTHTDAWKLSSAPFLCAEKALTAREVMTSRRVKQEARSRSYCAHHTSQLSPPLLHAALAIGTGNLNHSLLVAVETRTQCQQVPVLCVDAS